MVKLEAKNIACKKGDRVLFSKLSFWLKEGECLVVKGHNGSGKSSLLKIFTGLALPSKGSIWWQEQSIRVSTRYRQESVYLGHKDSLRQGLTAYENIWYGLTLAAHQPAKEDFFRVTTALNLNKILNLPTLQLSAGQKRKVALATILLQGKKIWLLDEPCAALDQESTQQLGLFFQRHLAQGGLIIMACHDDNPQAHITLELKEGTHSLKREPA